MTAPQAGALSRADLKWPAIDWQAAQQIVRRLQTRIVKATLQRRSGQTSHVVQPRPVTRALYEA